MVPGGALRGPGSLRAAALAPPPPLSHQGRTRGGCGPLQRPLRASVLPQRPRGALTNRAAASGAVIAVDIGTTGTKACLVDPTGLILGEGYSRYARATYSGGGGVVEQQPEDWLDAFGEACRQCLEGRDAGVGIAGVALSGQMQDVVLMDGTEVIRPAILYSDTRARHEAEQIEAAAGALVARDASNYKGAASCLAKLLWLQRHEPGNLARSTSILLGAHDYMACILTGGESTATDLTTASTTGLLLPSGDGWATELMGAVGLTAATAALPALPPSAEAVGRVEPAVAAELGLPELQGVLVFHGTGDLAATSMGVPGAAYAYVGTSGWIACTRDLEEGEVLGRSGVEGLFEVHHPVPGRGIFAASMTTAGGNVEWARSTLFDGARTALSEFDAAAATAPPGSGGVLFLPHLAGERSPFTDPSARAGFVGVGATTSKGALECEVAVMGSASHVAARGCASLAMEGLGLWENGKPPAGFFGDARGGEAAQVTRPDPAAVDALGRSYEVYSKLHAALRGAGVGSL